MHKDYVVIDRNWGRNKRLRRNGAWWTLNVESKTVGVKQAFSEEAPAPVRSLDLPCLLLHPLRPSAPPLFLHLHLRRPVHHRGNQAQYGGLWLFRTMVFGSKATILIGHSNLPLAASCSNMDKQTQENLNGITFTTAMT